MFTARNHVIMQQCRYDGLVVTGTWFISKSLLLLCNIYMFMEYFTHDRLVVTGTWLITKSLLLSTELIYSQVISFQNFATGFLRNFAHVLGACCNWQPDCLPSDRSGFKPRRLHHSLSCFNSVYWYRSM